MAKAEDFPWLGCQPSVFLRLRFLYALHHSYLMYPYKIAREEKQQNTHTKKERKKKGSMKKMGNLISLLFLFFLWSSSSSGLRAVSGATTSEECSNDLQKVMSCMNYATGKANAPTKDCCSSVAEVKDSDPKCLCYMMLQTHNGSDQIKSFGIQEAKLLQLPSACQLKNASISFCPGLLGLSPSSPDAAIFTNASSSAAPATSTGTSATETVGSSNEEKHRPCFAGPLVIAMAIFTYVLSACIF